MSICALLNEPISESVIATRKAHRHVDNYSLHQDVANDIRHALNAMKSGDVHQETKLLIGAYKKLTGKDIPLSGWYSTK